MVDYSAIASAVATRFLAAAITPPSGYTDPGTAVWQLPTAITTTPMAVVFPPEGEFSYASFRRTGNLDFPVRWYIADTADLPRATREMYAWTGVLMDQLEPQFDLDQSSNGVTHAVITNVRFGKLDYAGQEYTGIEMNVRVHLEQAISPTT
jgi:hypothetical protein